MNSTTQPKGASHLHTRKLSVQDEIARITSQQAAEAILDASDSKNKTFSGSKKLSLAPKLRAHSTLQYTTPIPAAPRGATTAEPTQFR